MRGEITASQLGSTGSSSSRPVQVVTGQQGSASGYLEKVVELMLHRKLTVLGEQV